MVRDRFKAQCVSNKPDASSNDSIFLEEEEEQKEEKNVLGIALMHKKKCPRRTVANKIIT